MITVYCISHVPALLLLKIPGYGGATPLLMFYLLLVVQMSDVLQYVCGKLFGHTKIAPAVSPSKTVEGFVGGAAGAVAVGAAMWWITPFTLLQAAGMAAIIVLMGFSGGLVLSAVKRSLGAKDWGSMIEGHGGMLGSDGFGELRRAHILPRHAILFYVGTSEGHPCLATPVLQPMTSYRPPHDRVIALRRIRAADCL
jgi:predicted CDP-diglyceride synthetase/phosphatidate cytidylyltransferase